MHPMLHRQNQGKKIPLVERPVIGYTQNTQIRFYNLQQMNFKQIFHFDIYLYWTLEAVLIKKILNWQHKLSHYDMKLFT